MVISIEYEDGTAIERLELESNPFVIGQVLNLKVENHDPEFWTDKPELNESYEIINIETFVRCTYGRLRQNVDRVDVSVYVKHKKI